MAKEALLIVDMSNDFVADNGTLTVGKPAQAIVSYIKETAQAFLDNGQVVVVSMDAHEENDPHFDLWPAHNVTGSYGQQLYGELQDWFEANQNHDQLYYQAKTNYNAFFKTGLADQLRQLEVEKVHVVGVTTDIFQVTMVIHKTNHMIIGNNMVLLTMPKEERTAVDRIGIERQVILRKPA